MSQAANTSWVLVSLVVALAAYVATVRRQIVDRMREIKRELEEAETGVVEIIEVTPAPADGNGKSTRKTVTQLVDGRKQQLEADLRAYPRSVLALTAAEAVLIVAGLMLAGTYGWRQLGLEAPRWLELWGIGFFLQALVYLSVLHFVEWIKGKNRAWLVGPPVGVVTVALLVAIIVAVVTAGEHGA